MAPDTVGTAVGDAGTVAPGTVGTATTRIRFRYDTVDGCCGPTDQTGWYIDNFIATSTCK